MTTIDDDPFGSDAADDGFGIWPDGFAPRNAPPPPEQSTEEKQEQWDAAVAALQASGTVADLADLLALVKLYPASRRPRVLTKAARHAGSKMTGRPGVREAFIAACAACDADEKVLSDVLGQLASTEREADAAAVTKRVAAIRADRAAREQLATESAAQLEIPPIESLADILGRPRRRERYAIDRLNPVGGNVLFAGPAKAGKTVLVLNLIRSLADGVPFLGQFGVAALDSGERVAQIDVELPEAVSDEWLDDIGIERVHAVCRQLLRGRVSSFDVLDPAGRARWALQLRRARVTVAILDCLTPVMSALGVDPNTEARRVLDAFDELKAEAGIRELYVIHHFGHGPERARGDSSLLGWPDALWKIVRNEGDETRYFTAEGRNVDVPEIALSYDPDTRRLTTDSGAPGRKRAGRPASRPEDIEAKIGLADEALREMFGDGWLCSEHSMREAEAQALGRAGGKYARDHVREAYRRWDEKCAENARSSR